MILRIKEFSGPDQVVSVDSGGLPLSVLLKDHTSDIEACQINGDFVNNWKDHISCKGDVVTLYPKVKDPYSVGYFIGKMLAYIIISSAISAVIGALTPKPKKPNMSARTTDEVFGVGGIRNTALPGTPEFVVYGKRRVFGILIATKVSVGSDGKTMEFSALYFMGDTGGDGYESIGSVQINESDVANYSGVTTEVRLGTDPQTVIRGFEDVENAFSDGQSITAVAITYVTKSEIDKATLILSFPGIYKVNSRGGTNQGSAVIKVETRATGSGDPFVEISGSPFTVTGDTQSILFHKIEVTFGSKDQWDVRITRNSFDSSAGDPVLYNVQEAIFTTLTYAGSALLAIFGVGSSQITSFDSMRVSALVEGKKVKVWDGATFVTEYTRKRVWHVRDMLTHSKVGLGHRIPESMFNDDTGLTEQGYYDDSVAAYSGTEARDLCDFILNTAKPGWDWIKGVAGEGRARLIPSGGKFKYLIDRPRTPNLLYSYPGNIIEASSGGPIKTQITKQGGEINTVRATFADDNKNYAPNTLELKDSAIGSDPVRPEDMQFDTVVRESQVNRELMYALKKRLLLRRYFNWTSPRTAQISEPMDQDYLNYSTINNKRGYQGFIAGSSTTTTAELDRRVTLESGTYDIIVRHQVNNVVEKRTISTGVGTWGKVDVTVVFTTAPAEGDVWAVGKQSASHILEVIMDNVAYGDSGDFDLSCHEYVAAIYTLDALPTRSTRRYFSLSNNPPIPLLDAKVYVELGLDKDGAWVPFYIFDVTPGLPLRAGTAQSGGVNTIQLAADEVAIDGYYAQLGTTVKIISGTGSGQEKPVTAYNGTTKTATVDANWTTQPDVTSKYEMRFLIYGSFIGFKVEKSASSSGPWTFMGRVLGTRLKLRAIDDDATEWFRFTPFAPGDVDNLLSRQTKSIANAGDTTAPAAPASVVISSYLKTVTVDTSLTRPLDRDFAGIEIELWRTAIGGGGTLIKTVRIGAPQDQTGSGTMIIRRTFSLDAEAYDAVILASVKSVDFSDNRSSATDSGSTTLTRVVTGDVTANAITQVQSYANDATATVTDESETEVGTITITTQGGPVLVIGKFRAQNASVALTVLCHIRRGSDVSGALIDKGEVLLTASNPATVMAMYVDSQAAGTYTYKLWFQPTADCDCSYRRLQVVELKR